MKIIVERDRLLVAVDAATRVAGGATTIPILQNLLLKPNGKAISITGTHMEAQLEASAPADIEGAHADGLTLPGAALGNIVRGLPNGSQLSIEWDALASPYATLVSARSRYKLLTLSAMDFPELLQAENAVKFAIPGKLLADCLSMTDFAMNRKDARVYMAGIYLHFTDEHHPSLGQKGAPTLRFTATDGFNMAIASQPAPNGMLDLGETYGVILPRDSITEIVRLATAAGTDDVAIAVTRTLAVIEAVGKRYTTKLVDGTFPAYTSVIPKEFNRQAIVDVTELAEALGRLLAIDDGNRARITLGGDALRLRSVNHKLGEADEEIVIEYQGEDLDMGINARSWASILDNVNADVCIMRFVGDKSPTLVQPWRSNGNDVGVIDMTRTFLTMPME